MIITLFVAVLNDHTQQTLLTRFVPTELDDNGIQQKIDGLLADVNQILPVSIELLDPSPPPSDQD